MKTVSMLCMLCLNLFLLPIFNWHLLCVVYIVIDFNVLLSFLGLRLSIQGVFHVLARLSKCKFENLSCVFCPRTPKPQLPFDFFFAKNVAPKISPGYADVHTHIHALLVLSFPYRFIIFCTFLSAPIGLHLSYLVSNIVEFLMKDSDHDRAHVRSLSAWTFEIKVNLTMKGLPVIIVNVLESIFELQKEASN